MSAMEGQIFQKWLLKHENEYTGFDFDVRVGVGSIQTPKAGDKFEAGYKALTQKRIDVVAISDGDPTIIEVRPRADHTAVGNLMAYRVLFNTTFKADAKILVVSDSISEDDKTILTSLGIPFEIV